MSDTSKFTRQSSIAYGACDDQEVLDASKFDNEKSGAMVDDPMTYSLAWLKGWGVFSILTKTVWDNPTLWRLMGRLMLLALFVGVLSYFLMPDPEHLDASKFSAIASVLTLFVTLMLSFFLSTSVSRWIRCVDGFLDLFNAIRNLAMQLHALGVDHAKLNMCLRFGVLSATFLVHELRTRKYPEDIRAEAHRKMWDELESADASDYRRILPGEREVLEPIADTAGQMWIWVGSLVGRMAMDGDVPPMASPTYGRIMNLGQNAQEALRQVRTELVVQMPFVYVHTLATLVHVNSILLAINLGFAVGVTTHGIQDYINHHYYESSPDVIVQPLTSQIQTFVVELTRGFLGPLLYQAFLEIGIAVVSPFSDTDAAIPVLRLMRNLERDLAESFILAENTPLWEKPMFKVPDHPVAT